LPLKAFPPQANPVHTAEFNAFSRDLAALSKLVSMLNKVWKQQ